MDIDALVLQANAPDERLTLQINTSGAWRNVCKFDPSRRDEVVAAAKVFGQVLGDGVSWGLLHPNGTRAWL